MHNVEDLPMTDERGKPRPSGTIEHWSLWLSRRDDRRRLSRPHAV